MFQSARLKLTLWYLLTIAIISLSFSLVIYKFLTSEVDRLSQQQRYRIESLYHQTLTDVLESPFPNPNTTFTDADLIVEIKRRILIGLGIVDGGILILSGVFAYVLSGRTLSPIKEMIDEQNQFISDASHELRTPLTAMKSDLEVHLRDSKLTLKDAKKLLEQNLDDVNRLQSLSDSLLQLAQYQKPISQLKFEKTTTQQIVEKARAKVASAMKAKNIKIEEQGKNYELTGDRYGLEEVLIVLLDNAIKYSPAKSTIKIVTSKTDALKIAISDQGIGVAPQDLPHIFDRFYRADAARSKQNLGGYGLGLSIAKRIVELHQGSITVTSKKGMGTTFTIRLPRNLNLFS